MKHLITFLLLTLSISAFAQTPDTASLGRSVSALNRALVKKDSFRLKMLLRNDLHYYHSNGWMQTKEEVIADLFNGKLTYTSINTTEESIHVIDKNLAHVQMVADMEVVLEGKPMKLQLNVVQMWGLNKDGRWELFTRRSKRVQPKTE